MRRGVTMIELTITVLILAISAAAVIPNWLTFQEKVTATSAAMALSSDIRALRTYAIRASTNLTIEPILNSSILNIQPPAPEVMGDALGNMDFSNAYAGSTFSQASFGGDVNFVINMHGDFVSATDGARLQDATVQVQVGQQSASVNLLMEILVETDAYDTTPSTSSGSSSYVNPSTDDLAPSTL
ncbi:MAG: prepilin-type N-terminal cleavage/methylation domain-containing protein [Planctomycetota bacterium]